MRLLSLLFFYLQNVLHLTNQPKKIQLLSQQHLSPNNSRQHPYLLLLPLRNLCQHRHPAPVAKEFIRENYGYVDYKELARNPDPYKGKSLTYSGKVIQVIEGDTETQHRIAVNGDYDNVIYVAYPKNIVTSRILDDDYVTVYGTSLGLYSYQSTMGGKITVPALYLDRIELQQ